MSRIIAFANQKGGVGKTTSAINIAACLGSFGKKVLLFDLDAQGNASSGVGIEKRKVKASSFDILTENKKVSEVMQKTEFKGLYIVPSTMDLAGAEIVLSSMDSRESRLKAALNEVEGNFDYIIIDCPPSLGLLTLNALCAAREVIVPMQCEYFALEGLSQLTYTIDLVKKMYNSELDLRGVVLTMFDGRLNLSLAVAHEIKKYFPNKVFKNTVPRNVRLSEAPSHGKPIIYYDRNSRGAIAYTEIAKEIDQRG